MIARGDTGTLDALLQALVDRDCDVLSVGVRTIDGELLMAAGPHADWTPPPEDKSTAEQMQVPIFQQGDQKWGTVEFRFASLAGTGPWQWMTLPQVRFLAFVSLACFLTFAVILRIALRHLDPSKAVPRRVREALDNLAEGLLILDTRGQILLANNAFASVAGVGPDKLMGVSASSLRCARGKRPAGDRTRGRTPWGRAVRYRTSGCS